MIQSKKGMYPGMETDISRRKDIGDFHCKDQTSKV